MSFPTKLEQDQKTRAAEYRATCQQSLAAIYAAYPTITRNQANEAMIGYICAEYLGKQTHQVAPTLDVFRSAVETDPSLLGSINGSGVATETVKQQRIELIEDICELLRAPDPSGRGGRYSSFNIDSVRSTMQAWSLDALRARRDEIIRAQSLNERPLAELKKMVHDAQPQFAYARLPRTIVPPGSVTSVPLDASYLRKLEPWELRRFLKIYGPSVNSRLQGKD